VALVGSISGSNSTIGVSGSVIFADRPAGTYPTFPGADVSFFVSGTIGGKNGTSRNVAVFGGDAAISGSLTVGTGSILITSNDIQIGSTGHLQIGSSTNRIALAGSDLKFFDGNNVSGVTLSSLVGGGGGGGDTFFSSTTDGSIFTTGSAAFRGAESIDSPADKGTDVFFFVSGSTANGSGVALFSGNIRSSGSLTLDGDVAVNGGDITTSASTFNLVNTVTTLNVGTGATTVNIGQASNAINVAGNLDVNGTSDLAGTVTLSGNSQAVTHTGTGDLTISSTTGQVLVENTVFNGNNVTIPGNLTVRGTTVSVDTTNLKVFDPLILVGSGSSGPSAKGAIAFASGSATTAQALLIGPAGGSDVMAVARQDVQDGALAQASISFTDLVPLRASQFQVGGSSAFVTSSNGSEITVKGASTATVLANNGALTLSGTTVNGVTVAFGGVSYAEMRDNGTGNLRFGTFAGEMTVSGSIVNLDAGTSGFRFKQNSSAQQFLNVFAPGSTVAQIGAFGTNRGLTLATAGGTGDVLTLSGSSAAFNNGNNGVQFQKNSTQYMSIFNPTGLTAQISAGTATNSNLKLATNGGTTDTVELSSSIQAFNHTGGSGVQYKKDNVQYLGIKYPSAGNASIASTIGNDTFTINSTAGAGSTDKLILSGSTLEVVGTTVSFKVDNTAVANVKTDNGLTGLFPNADATYYLGSPSLRWAHIYTGDLHLRNDRGNWTIIEEAEYLTITNNLNGKRYKFVLEEL